MPIRQEYLERVCEFIDDNIVIESSKLLDDIISEIKKQSKIIDIYRVSLHGLDFDGALSLIHFMYTVAIADKITIPADFLNHAFELLNSRYDLYIDEMNSTPDP